MTRRGVGWLAVALGTLAMSVPDAAGAGWTPTLRESLIISGSFTGYATFTIDGPITLHYGDAVIQRSGSYAGAVIDTASVVISSSEWPDSRQRMYWSAAGDAELRRAGTYRAYLITEAGRYATVQIPWTRPSARLHVLTEADHEFHIKRLSQVDTSQPTIELPQRAGGAHDEMWVSSTYESHQATNVHLDVGVRVTRRAKVVGGTHIYGDVSSGAFSAQGGVNGDVRGVSVLGFVKTTAKPPMTKLDQFTVWSLRLSLNGYVLPFAY